MKETMQAFVRTSYQTMDIQLATVAIPEITPEEILVQVKAFGVVSKNATSYPMMVLFPML